VDLEISCSDVTLDPYYSALRFPNKFVQNKGILPDHRDFFRTRKEQKTHRNFRDLDSRYVSTLTCGSLTAGRYGTQNTQWLQTIGPASF